MFFAVAAGADAPLFAAAAFSAVFALLFVPDRAFNFTAAFGDGLPPAAFRRAFFFARARVFAFTFFFVFFLVFFGAADFEAAFTFFFVFFRVAMG